MTAPTNKPQSDPSKTQGSVPSSDVPSYGEVPKIVWSQIEGAGWLNCCYTLDGKYGWAKTNGEMAIHFDTLNNMIFTAGAPGQSGCGGKMINVSKGGKIDKHSSVSIEVTGRQDDGKISKTKTDKGTTEEKKVPAYSLKVYGDILIECVGGEVAIKGDNITLNAASTLNLKSGKDINIEAGGKSGRVNINGGALNLNVAQFKKTITGVESTEGAGEVSNEQYHPGASTSINTPGSIKYTVNGNYEVGVTGDYKSTVTKNYSLSVTGDYAESVTGNRSDKVQGKYKVEVNGLETKPASTQQENYLLKVGAGKSKTIPAYSVLSGSGAKISSTIGNFTVEIGKQLGVLDLSEKTFKTSIGKALGSIEINEKDTVIAFGKTSKVSVNPAKISIEATAIYLN